VALLDTKQFCLMMSSWISAARPRTLPLALSSILMGCFLAYHAGHFNWTIAILTVTTTVLLQILSNFANDYGDGVSGKDNDARQGPKRAVQSGDISATQMKRAMLLFSGLAFVSGVGLLYQSLKDSPLQTILFFLGLGVLSIIAAITYTAGKRPYGYAGFGDIAVLVFFGWVGVLGTYYLHTKTFDWVLLLPATSCGLFAVGVLNINNIRDIESDMATRKLSIPVRLGRPKAVIYHWFLLILAMICTITFSVLEQKNVLNWLFLLSFPLFIYNGYSVATIKNAKELDPFLKQMALSTLFFVLLFGIGLF
jgi:1,4-dihydroxy-2-naphthoate polyprenyltransferase